MAANKPTKHNSDDVWDSKIESQVQKMVEQGGTAA
jgi:hypothetical protein